MAYGEKPRRTYERPNPLGLASIVCAGVAASVCWIPLFGVFAWPMSLASAVLGSIGLTIAYFDRRSSISLAAAGIVVGTLAFGISIYATRPLVRSWNAYMDQIQADEAKRVEAESPAKP